MPRYRGMPKYLTFVPKREDTEMRQLKGKIKENAREKRQRKKEFMENLAKLFTVVLPTLGVLIALILVAMVYMNSRPKSVIEG